MKEKIQTDKAPAAPSILSQAIVSNGIVFVSGQIHNNPDGSMVDGTTEEKVKQIMQNIKEILSAAQSSLNEVVKVAIYVTEMSVMLELNEVYPTYFSEPYPAREAVCVKELPLGATIEMSVIAQQT